MPGFKARWEPMESILERAIGSSERMGSLGFSAGSKETGEHETKVPIFFSRNQRWLQRVFFRRKRVKGGCFN